MTPQHSLDPGAQAGSLAGRFPQVSTRARVYGLADDGASDLARRKRAAKDSAANSRLAIERILRRQAGENGMTPLPDDMAERMLAGHRKRLAAFEQREAPAGPDVPVLAPVGRRVSREDRRRRKAAKRL